MSDPVPAFRAAVVYRGPRAAIAFQQEAFTIADTDARKATVKRF